MNTAKSYKEIEVLSSLDNSLQPSLFFKAEGDEKRPLLVGLHTWSYNRFNQVENMLPYAKKYNFHLLLPEFRGANIPTNPNCEKACGSDYAIQDIFDAINYVKSRYSVDEENIFLLGASGGGFASLLCGAKEPKTFKAIGAFVPICDLLAWKKEAPGYGEQAYICCGNSESEMARRSPVTYFKELSQANVKIFHGKFDNVVPFTQSVNLYLKIMEYNPTARVFLDLFDGGHEMDIEVAFSWLISQYEKAKLTSVTG